jgi:hypothetical protein
MIATVQALSRFASDHKEIRVIAPFNLPNRYDEIAWNYRNNPSRGLFD